MSMKRKFATSSFWTIVAATFNNLSTMITFIVLARLLTPTEFGIVAFATIFVEISRIVVLGGIPDALIQRREWDDELASTAFWTNMAMAVMVAGLLSLVGAPLASIYYDATFAWVLAALSLLLLVGGSSAIHVAKLRRDFRHKAIAQRTMVSNVVSGVIGVSLALYGWGVWALVISRLVAVSGTSVMLWMSTDFRPRFSFSLRHLRSIGGFSTRLLGSQLLNHSGGQIPALLIGGFLGPAAIAQYRVGARALELVISLVISPVQSAAVSALSRLSHDRELLGGAYLRVTKMCALLSCPVFFGLAAIAPDFVPFVFGSQWQAASYVLVGLAVSALPITLGYFEGVTTNAAGRSDLTFINSLIGNVGGIVAAALSLPFGPVGVAFALSIRGHLTLPIALGLVKKVTAVTRMEAVRGVLPAYLCAAGMAATVTALRLLVLDDLSIVVRLVLAVTAGLITYLTLLIIFARPYLRANLAELMPLMPEGIRVRLKKSSFMKTS